MATKTTTKEEIAPLLAECKQALAEHYGDRFRGLFLFGSVARGEDEPDSDIDLMVLLADEFQYGKELWNIIRLFSPLQMKYGRMLSPIPAVETEFERKSQPLYKFAREEGKYV